MSQMIRIRAIAFVAAAALACGAWSASAQTKSSSMPAASKASHSVSGTLEKFDATGKMLTVHTSKGTETLALSSDAKIQEGGRSLTPADLASHTGSHVRVSYTEHDGQKMAQEVRLSAKAPGYSAKPKKQE